MTHYTTCYCYIQDEKVRDTYTIYKTISTSEVNMEGLNTGCYPGHMDLLCQASCQPMYRYWIINWRPSVPASVSSGISGTIVHCFIETRLNPPPENSTKLWVLCLTDLYSRHCKNKARKQHFQKHPRSSAPLCSTKNVHLVYF